MILFAADRHYDQHCGRHLREALDNAYDIAFHEADWTCFLPGQCPGVVTAPAVVETVRTLIDDLLDLPLAEARLTAQA